MQTAFKIGLVLTIFATCELNCLAGNTEEPARVFKPAIEKIRNKTQIPILLPWKLPWLHHQGLIKFAWGEVRKDGYFISLFYDEPGVNANYSAGFGASTEIDRDLGDPVQLANGIVAQFRPVSCGGSCAPANLWWEQNGVMYQIQIRFSSNTEEEKQKEILIETANCSVKVRTQ